MAIQFGGVQIGRPGAFSVVDDENMIPQNIGTSKTLGYVGVATSLKEGIAVGKPLRYTAASRKQAEADLGTGDLINNMKIAWKHGADEIIVVVVSKTASTESPATDAEWQTAIDALVPEFIDGIVAVTTETAILTKVKEHVTDCSDVLNRKERRAFYGHKAGMTKEAIITAVTPLKDERMVVASPAVYEYKPDGTKELKTSVELASAYAGLWAVKEAQDPLTYDYVQFAGLETQYVPQEIVDLIAGGVMVCEQIKGGGIRIVRAVTSIASENLAKVELSVSTVADTVSIEMREYLENKHVGKAGVAGIETTIYNDAISKLEEFKKRNLISSYVKDSVVVTRNATTFTVDWEGKPVLPVNNFLITTHFTL